MASESMGTARIDIIVDTDQYEAALKRSESLVANMGESAQRAYANMSKEQKRAADSALRFVEQQKLTTEGWRLMKLQMQGLPKGFIDDVRAALQRQRDELEATNLAQQTVSQGFTDMQRKAKAAARELKEFAAADALERTKREMRELQKAADEVNNALREKAANDEWARSQERQARNAGKLKSEILALDAAERGLTARMAPAVAMLQAHEKAMERAKNQTKGMALTARELEIAMRGVPAQLTDIGVSLAGGQSPLMVLLQQGGQLRDTFHGFRPAIQAFGQTLAKLVTPATLTALAVGGIVTAAHQGAQETNAYAKALAVTGNAAGLTVSELDRMSDSIALGAITQAESARALAEVAKSGKFTAEQLQFVADAAINMESATGQALSETIDQFSRLKDEPTKAVAKLNEETHFLTIAVFEQIAALEEQGRSQEASALAMETYASAVRDRADNVRENLGLLESAWRNLAAGAKFAWDQMLGLGRDNTLNDKIRTTAERITELQTSRFGYLQYGAIGSDARKAEIEKSKKELRGLLKQQRDENRKVEIDAAAQRAQDYGVALQSEILAHKSASDKRDAEMRRIAEESARKVRDLRAKGTKDALDAADELERLAKQRIAQIKSEQDKANKPKSDRGARSLSNAESREELAALKADEDAKRNIIQNSTQILQAEYNARLVDADGYFSKMRSLNEQDTAAQVDSLQKQIAALQARNVTGVDAANVTRQITELESRLAQVRADATTRSELLRIQEQTLAEQRKNALNDYAAGLQAERDAMVENIAAQVARGTLSQKEYEQMVQLAAIAKEYAKELRRLAKEKRDGQITPEEYERYRAEAEKDARERVRITKDAFDEMDRAKDDWLGGMAAGFKDWMDQAADVATQARNMTQNAMDSIVDGVASAAEGNKNAWREMLIDMLRELEKFLIKQALLKAAYQIGTSFFGGGASTTAGSSGASFQTTFAANGHAFSQQGMYAFANGGTFTNDVYNKPTPFLFAKGSKFGVMGEAGPEAVMPLERGPDGKLGVRNYGGGAEGGGSNVSISIVVNADGSTNTQTAGNGKGEDSYRKFAENIKQIVREELRKSMAPQGDLWNAGVRS